MSRSESCKSRDKWGRDYVMNLLFTTPHYPRLQGTLFLDFVSHFFKPRINPLNTISLFVLLFLQSYQERLTSNPLMSEEVSGFTNTTIFGAPCDRLEFYERQDLKNAYMGCQNLPAWHWWGRHKRGGRKWTSNDEGWKFICIQRRIGSLYPVKNSPPIEECYLDAHYKAYWDAVK